MSPRSTTFLSLALGAVLAGCGGTSGDGEDGPPNVLVLAIDTLRADRLGAYGYERDTSPAIDALLERSVVFEDAQSTAPWTLPSFASILTSLHASTHGCWAFRSRLGTEFVTLPEILGDAGYSTYGIASHVLFAPERGLAQGFDTYDDELIYSAVDSGAAISSPEIVERALAEIDALASDDAPWFAWLHFFDPHTIYQAHPGQVRRFGDAPTDRYDGEIAFTDRHVGRVLAHLEELGVDDRTVVVLVADHGEEFREHGRLGHGKTLFQEVVRVPFAIRAPGVAPRRVDQVVSTVDLLPTLLELLEIEPPGVPVSGRSLAAAMRGELLAPAPALQQSRLDQRKEAELESLVTERWKLIVERERIEREGQGTAHARGRVLRRLLFDRAVDPGEQRDVAAEHPDVVAELAAQLDALVDEASALPIAVAPSDALRMSDDERRRLRSLGYLNDEGDE